MKNPAGAGWVYDRGMGSFSVWHWLIVGGMLAFGALGCAVIWWLCRRGDRR